MSCWPLRALATQSWSLRASLRHLSNNMRTVHHSRPLLLANWNGCSTRGDMTRLSSGDIQFAATMKQDQWAIGGIRRRHSKEAFDGAQAKDSQRGMFASAHQSRAHIVICLSCSRKLGKHIWQENKLCCLALATIAHS